MLAVAADAAQHGVGELHSVQAPIPLRASGEMLGTLKVPKGVVQREPAAELALVVLLGRGVARGAAADVEHGLAVGEALLSWVSERIGRQLGRARDHESDDAPPSTARTKASHTRERSRILLRAMTIPAVVERTWGRPRQQRISSCQDQCRHVAGADGLCRHAWMPCRQRNRLGYWESAAS